MQSSAVAGLGTGTYSVGKFSWVGGVAMMGHILSIAGVVDVACVLFLYYIANSRELASR
jgi:uncharacterized membrane protein